VHVNHEALTLASRVSEVGVLKRYGVDEGEGELGADFISLILPIRGRLKTGLSTG
jgi:hypothetical protein